MIDDDLCVPHVVCLRVFICFFWGGAQSPGQGVNWDDEVIHVLGLGTPYFLCRDLSIWINYGWTPDEQNINILDWKWHYKYIYILFFCFVAHVCWLCIYIYIYSYLGWPAATECRRMPLVRYHQVLHSWRVYPTSNNINITTTCNYARQINLLYTNKDL
jgi:hypothetical protein